MNNEKGHIVEGIPSEDFWEQNPEFEYLDFADRLIEKEGRDRAGVIMWAIYLVHDPDSTIYDAKMFLEDREAMIQKTYLNKMGVEKLDWKELSETVKHYVLDSMPTGKKRFKSLNDTVSRMVYEMSIKEELDEKTAQALSKIDSIWKGLSVVKQSYTKEKEQMTRNSGKKQSGKAGQKRNAHKRRGGK